MSKEKTYLKWYNKKSVMVPAMLQGTLSMHC